MCNTCIARCRCGCDNGMFVDFRFTKADGDVYVETVVPCFYAYQGGFIKCLFRRIKAAWFMLSGKEYVLHEIILDKERWNRFVSAINELSIEHCFDHE